MENHHQTLRSKQATGLLGPTGESNQQNARRFRTTRLWYAIIWSIISKTIGSAVQILGIPFAIHALGVEGYATYAALIAVCALPAVFTIRYGPDITAEAAMAFENGDVAKVRRFLWSTSTTSFVTVIALFLATIVIFAIAPTGGQIGQHFYSALFLLCCGLLTVSFTTVETIQAACQENHLLSVRGTISGLVSIVLLISLLPVFPSLFMLIFCLNGVPVLTKFINAILFLIRKPNLLPHRPDWDLRLGLKYAKRGATFTLAAGIAAYLCHQLPVLLAAIYLPVVQAAVVAASLQVILQFHSIISLITTPLVPAIADSIAKRDFRWAKQSLERVTATVVGYGILAGSAHFFFADFIYHRLLGDASSGGADFYRFASLYIFTISLENYLFLILCALSSTTLPYTFFVLRSILTGLACWLSFLMDWPAGMYIAQLVFSLLIVCIPLYSRIEIQLAALMRQHPNERTPDFA